MARWARDRLPPAVLIGLSVLGLAGCGHSGSQPTTRAGTSQTEPARTNPTRVQTAQAPQRRPRTGLASRLTLGQIAGQHVVYAYDGMVPPPGLISLIRAGEAAGVILFSQNIESVTQIASVTRELQVAAKASPIHAHLLIVVDQEGGEVRRLPGAPDLSEKQIGESDDPLALAQQAGTQAGLNLRSAGINVNLAPVLDVFRQPGNFIDSYGRSYSSNPTIAGELGATFIHAQQRESVAATAKHFPGLGAAATDQNTDEVPVTLNVQLGELRQVDELPYRYAMLAGVKLVMTSWAIYPALDPQRPAGLSPIVIGRELRHRLGFKGVVITDSVSAGALARYGSVGERAVLAARAGADLIICSGIDAATNTPATGIAVLRALREALADGDLSLTRAEQAASAVIALRRHP